jgi:tetratricopeptide (TPR) repeat protein
VKHSRRTILRVSVVVAVAVGLAVGVPRVRSFLVLRDATQQMQRHRFEAALATLDAGIPNDTTIVQVLMLRARCCRRLGISKRFHQLIAAAETAGAAPEPVRRELTLMHVQSGDLGDAGRLFAELILDGDDDLPEICEAFATGFLLTGRASDALGVLDAWSADFPDDAQAWLLKGESWHQLESADKAAKMLLKATQLDPLRWELQLACGQGLVEMSDYQQAVIHFDECLKLMAAESDGTIPLSDSLTSAVTGKARCLVANGEPNAAIAFLEQYPSVSSAPDALLIKGKVAMLDGDPAAAVSVLENALASRIWDTEIRSLLANALNASGRRDEAAAHFEYLGEASAALNEMESCLAAVQADPDNAELRFQIADIMLRYSDPREALVWLKSCLALAPDHRKALELLARTQD